MNYCGLPCFIQTRRQEVDELFVPAARTQKGEKELRTGENREGITGSAGHPLPPRGARLLVIWSPLVHRRFRSQPVGTRARREREREPRTPHHARARHGSRLSSSSRSRSRRPPQPPASAVCRATLRRLPRGAAPLAEVGPAPASPLPRWGRAALRAVGRGRAGGVRGARGGAPRGPPRRPRPRPRRRAAPAPGRQGAPNTRGSLLTDGLLQAPACQARATCLMKFARACY
jgi:hypothetical protein